MFVSLSHLPSPLLIHTAICKVTGTLKPPSSGATWSPCLSISPLPKLVPHSSSRSLWKGWSRQALYLALYPLQSELTQMLSSHGGTQHLTSLILELQPHLSPSSVLPTKSMTLFLLLLCGFLLFGFFKVTLDCQSSFRFGEKLLKIVEFPQAPASSLTTPVCLLLNSTSLTL